MKVVAALDGAGIRFTRHWGKFGGLDRERVAKDYGEDLKRWKKVQKKLLPTAADRRLFASHELVVLGLIDLEP